VPATFAFQVLAKSEAEAFKITHEGVDAMSDDAFAELGELVYGNEDYPEGQTLGDNRMILAEGAADRAFITEVFEMPSEPAQRHIEKYGTGK
jgi:hypothetical protein